MKLIIPLSHVQEDERDRVGGKAYALGVMMQKDMNVPAAVAITTEAYETFVNAAGLRTKIMMELNRKTYDDIRWEELWDISLRIRNMFLNTPLRPDLHETIKESVETSFIGKSVVVRSSSPGEDTSESSFAGLHASYVNVRGTESIIEHIKLVWASLWSDASLLYRKELGLDESKSSMAVVVQEIINGDVSGIGFGQNPNDPAQCVVESVYGLNQGLVDGTLEPDRWILDRTKGTIISHTPADRSHALYASEGGTELSPLPSELQGRPPLTEENIPGIYSLVMNAERIFGLPQDVEWTIQDNNIYVLQSRPITTLSGSEKDDKRGWYLSLKRSFDNLKIMRHTIEDELIPALQKETEDLAHRELSLLSDHEIRNEAAHRKDIFEKWKKIYWDYFIPFAHGMRLFGTIYNDTIHPSDPYEFLTLLSTGNMESLQRNDILQEMASQVRDNERLTHDLKEGDYSATPFSSLLKQLISSHGDLLCRSRQCEMETPDIINMVLEMASAPVHRRVDNDESQEREQMFLSHFKGQKREEAAEMLDIARASYRMRDNDNIYMGRLKARILDVQAEVSERSGTAERGPSSAGHFDSLSIDTHEPEAEGISEDAKGVFRLQTRQITGQPAGPGIATGPARVISHASDLMNFKKGEVLVCDSIDPNMTFVVPLAGGIVERRGGMLIHGAIIAREYGLPCVTGITRATDVISTGDRVTVDGYLGIVIIDSTLHTSSV
jgi:pyruvate,water dikinase